MKKPIFNLIDHFHLHINKPYRFLQQSQHWTAEQLEDYQLKQLLNVSQYFNLAIHGWEDFYDLALTTKDDIRQHNPKDGEEHIIHQTSGSTGRPLIFHSPKELEGVKPAIFQRAWNWIGRTNQLVLRLTAGPPQWAWYDYWRNVKPLNYREVTQEHLDFIIHKQPYLIHGQTGAIREITTRLLKQDREDVLTKIRLYLMSEDTQTHRKHLSPFYRSVHQGYGLAELCTVASECAYRNLHINMETAIVEIINGEIIVTDPFNYVTPLIRYRTGDLGKIKPSDCPCGIEHDILYDVQGREIDYYDGPEVKRPIGWWVVSPISHWYLGMIQAWRVEAQPKKGKLRLYVVWREECDPPTLPKYEQFIRDTLGLELEIVERTELPTWKRKLLKVTA